MCLFFHKQVFIFTAFKITTASKKECNQICPDDCSFICKYKQCGHCYQFCNECLAELYECEHEIKFVRTVEEECPEKCKQN
ncbi:hypothetical protein PVAND_015203 [Polypedilum vanderplanki]|uniref:Uncharacterized protein n=1 Tax=Polypedilum vanderplanki TaxID=319348 RepID=A0A9J6BBK9_POLVA|nr:hypothetical protein PVAND_015203 [Polypedilum vanderplanki]